MKEEDTQANWIIHCEQSSQKKNMYKHTIDVNILCINKWIDNVNTFIQRKNIYHSVIWKLNKWHSHSVIFSDRILLNGHGFFMKLKNPIRQNASKICLSLKYHLLLLLRVTRVNQIKRGNWSNENFICFAKISIF